MPRASPANSARAGRFDRIVYVSLPDRRARELILFKYLQKVPVAEILKKENAQPRRRASSFQKKRRAASEWLRRRRSRASALEADEGPPPDAGGTRAADSGPRKKARGKARKSLVSSAHDGAAHARQVVAKKLAALTPGFSGAELENLVNEAAILAARKSACMRRRLALWTPESRWRVCEGWGCSRSCVCVSAASQTSASLPLPTSWPPETKLRLARLADLGCSPISNGALRLRTRQATQ